MMIAPFQQDRWKTRRYRMPDFINADEVTVPNHFTSDFVQDFFTQEGEPMVYIAGRLPARVLFWRWWEPKF